MRTFIEAFEAGTKERERLEYEWNILQVTGNASRIKATVEEIKSARQKSYFPLTGAVGGRYLLSVGDFIIGGAANCSYLLFCAGVTKVDPIKFHLPFERFINPLLRGQAEIPLTIRCRKPTVPQEVDLIALLAEKGWGEEIRTPRERNGIMKEVLQETNGYLLFQEQAMELLHEVGGYSYAEADIIRRQLAKRLLLYGGKSLEEQFMGRARERGYENGEAREIFHEIVQYSGNLVPKCSLLGELLN